MAIQCKDIIKQRGFMWRIKNNQRLLPLFTQIWTLGTLNEKSFEKLKSIKGLSLASKATSIGLLSLEDCLLLHHWNIYCLGTVICYVLHYVHALRKAVFFCVNNETQPAGWKGAPVRIERAYQRWYRNMWYRFVCSTTSGQHVFDMLNTKTLACAHSRLREIHSF